MSLPYREGTWFAVPLRRGGFAVGVVARTSREGKVLLGYFFGPRRRSVPSLADVQSSRPQDATLVVRFGDLSLIQGEWPIVGDTRLDRSSWTVPDFARTDPLSGRSWRVRYDDRDPNVVVSEDPIVTEPALPRDGLYGAGAVEAALDRKLQ